MATRKVTPFRIIALNPIATLLAGKFAYQLGIIIDGGSAPNNPPTADAIFIGDIEVNFGYEITSAELLAGVTDVDGDIISVTSLTSVVGGNVTGSNPWTITPTLEGPGNAVAVITDGRGGILNRTVYWSGVIPVEAPEYIRKDDYVGMYRARIANTSSYITVPQVNYNQSTDTISWEFGMLVYSDEAYTGTVVDTRISRGTASSTRNAIIKTLDGSVQYRTDNNVTLTIGPSGTWPLNEFVRFKVTNHPTNGIVLEKMDANGVYQHIQTTPRSTATVYLPTHLMGNATTGVHGTILYWACTKNGTVEYDFRMDEMTGSTIYSSHDPLITATYVQGLGGFLVWKDETPESLAPQPDISVSGTLTHGSTMTLSSGTLTFPGGMPQAYIYDDMVGKSGQVTTSATIGSYTQVKNANVNQTYKADGPGGRPYIVRYDGPSTERIARVWNPGFQFNELFASRQIRIPQYWPGSNDDGAPWTPVPLYIPRDSTWKDVWGLTADDGGNSGSDIILGSHVSADHYKHGGNSTTLGGYNAPGTFSLNSAWVWNEWTHMENYAKFNSLDPQNGRHVMTLTNSRAKKLQSVSFGAVLCADRGYPLLNIIIDGAWLDENNLTRVEAAETYLAAGDNAACRVVITNSPIWLKGTKSAIGPLLTHSSGSVSFRVGLGTMNPATETLYAYYIGPTGVPSYTYGKRLN